MTERVFEVDSLKDADLVVCATYRGGNFKDVRDDPIAPYEKTKRA